MSLLVALVIGGLTVELSNNIHQINPSLSKHDLGIIARSIVQASRKFNLDPKLVASVIAVESGFRIKARGAAGEVGLMQLHPNYHHTGYGVYANIEAGVRYLAEVKNKISKDLGLKFVEYYNRGMYRQGVKTFPYAARVLGFYNRFGGKDGQERTVRDVQPVKERHTNDRRIASKADYARYY